MAILADPLSSLRWAAPRAWGFAEVARFFECRQCWTTFEPVTERHRAPCGHNPGAWFIRTTITLQRGRTPVRKNQ